MNFEKLFFVKDSALKIRVSEAKMTIVLNEALALLSQTHYRHHFERLTTELPTWPLDVSSAIKTLEACNGIVSKM